MSIIHTFFIICNIIFQIIGKFQFDEDYPLNLWSRSFIKLPSGGFRMRIVADRFDEESRSNGVALDDISIRKCIDFGEWT